jgi:hypothetical protein
VRTRVFNPEDWFFFFFNFFKKKALAYNFY